MVSGEWRMEVRLFHLPLPIHHSPTLTIRRVPPDVPGDLAFPALAVLEKLVLVIEEFLPGLDRELHVGPLHDRVHRARLLAKSTIDTFYHVDVVAGRAARAVVPARPRFDRDGLGGTDGFAQLTGDAPLLAVGIAAKGVLAPEPGTAMTSTTMNSDSGRNTFQPRRMS